MAGWKIALSVSVVVLVVAIGLVSFTMWAAHATVTSEYDYDQHMRDIGCTGTYDATWSTHHPRYWTCPPGVKP